MKRAPLMLLLTLVLSLCLTAAGSAETQQDLIGTQMPDFTVTAIDGETYTFSEVLLEKELVLINIFATWCPPCAMEFPAMEEAYQQYRTRWPLSPFPWSPLTTRKPWPRTRKNTA